jgi:hypothetical protein
MSASPPGQQAEEVDDNMHEDSPAPSSEGEDAIDLRPGAGGGDSSEEDQTDSEEEREVRKGTLHSSVLTHWRRNSAMGMRGR